MTKKVNNERRGFIGKLLAGGAVVATGGIVAENADAATEKEKKEIPSFNSLYRKLRDNHQSFTESDIIYYAMYINSDPDNHKCFSAFMMSLDVHNRNLHKGKSTPEAQYIVAKLHKLVLPRIVSIIESHHQLINGTLSENKMNESVPYFDGKDHERYPINWEID